MHPLNFSRAQRSAGPAAPLSRQPLATGMPTITATQKRVLDALETGSTGTSNQLADQLGIPKGTVHSSLYALERMGLARSEPKVLEVQGRDRECFIWSAIYVREPSTGEPANLTIVQSALLKQPALARVWGRAQA